MSRRLASLRGLLWRVGVGGPPARTLRRSLGRVAAALEDWGLAQHAARILGVPGLYRSPSCWGGDADRPPGFEAEEVDWALRCQAASFEVAVALGAEARPFVEEHAFGPLPLLHGVALRALLRLDARGSEGSRTRRAWDRILELDAESRHVALDALRRELPRERNIRRRFASGLEGLVERAKDARSRILALDPLTRLAPERARRFLPELRGLLVRGGQEALEAALLVRALDPRDRGARDVLEHFAQAHPDPEVRSRLESRLRPPYPVFRRGTA